MSLWQDVEFNRFFVRESAFQGLVQGRLKPFPLRAHTKGARHQVIQSASLRAREADMGSVR